jgi:hypothetical protein
MCSFWGGSHSWGAFLRVSTCLSVWVSSFFSPAPPSSFFFPPRSSDPRPTCSSGPPPQPPAGPYEGVGGAGLPPSSRSGIGWLGPQQEGSEERDISADGVGTVGLQPEMSLMREAKVAPAPEKGGQGRLHFLSPATDSSPSCLYFPSCNESNSKFITTPPEFSLQHFPSQASPLVLLIPFVSSPS